MPTPRMPSAAQIRSQMRAAERKAEREINAELKKAQRRAETEMSREIKKFERDTNRKLNAARPRVVYSTQERLILAPVAERAAAIAERDPDRRDVFLCHAWPDREGAAKELYDHLDAFGVDVWFSEKDVPLGVSLLRAIDKGLKISKIGVVLVTPAMLTTLANEGIADKELSALLVTERVIPVCHETTFDDLNDESPLLASRAGITTAGSSLEEVAVKIAETVRPQVA